MVTKSFANIGQIDSPCLMAQILAVSIDIRALDHFPSGGLDPIVQVIAMRKDPKYALRLMKHGPICDEAAKRSFGTTVFHIELKWAVIPNSSLSIKARRPCSAHIRIELGFRRRQCCMILDRCPNRPQVAVNGPTKPSVPISPYCPS